MLQPSTVSILGRFFSFSVLIGSLPFQWDSSSQTLCVTRSRYKLLQWHVTISYCILYTTFITVRFTEILVSGGSMQTLVVGALSLTAWITLFFFHINTILYKHEICSFVNHFIVVNEKFRGIAAGQACAPGNTPGGWRNWWLSLDNCGKFICIICWICAQYAGGMCFIIITIRNHPVFLYSVFPYFQKCSWVLLIPWGLNESFWIGSAALTAIFYVFIIFGYCFSQNQTLALIRFKSNQSTDATGFSALYRQLQVLNIIYNGAFQGLLLPMLMAMFMVLPMSYTFAAFKLYSSFQGGPEFYVLPMMSMALVVTATFLLTMCFRLNVLSGEVIDSWREHAGGMSRHVLRACTPIGIRVGPFCIVQPNIVSDYGKHVVNNTTSLLLAFKEY